MAAMAAELKHCTKKVLHFSCEHCQLEYPSGTKHCAECGRVVRYHCVGSGCAGLYSNFARHRATCTACGPGLVAVTQILQAEHKAKRDTIEAQYEGKDRKHSFSM